MKPALISIFIVFTCSAFGQNYQCLQSGVKHYFTNNNGYLRGIRVDSVKTFGDSTVYYPFHTPRGNYTTTGAPVTLDSAGGSWLGKSVVQCADGTFVFDNLWHDTVVIKTLAAVGDTWIFYQDTTALYYQASVIALDTMTILGVLDSVKRILITAHNASGIVTTDLADSLQIILSKNNGFAQVFDLFTFPYHEPGSGYASGLDYYLDNISGVIYPGNIIEEAFSVQYNSSNAIFKISALLNPTQQQLYNWNVGDVYEYSTCSGLPGWMSPVCDPVQAYYLDTILTKTVTSSNKIYNYSGLVANYSDSSSALLMVPGGTYITNINEGAYTFGNTYLIDTTLMPEESHQQYLYYYTPNDSSYCAVSPLYGFSNNAIHIDQYYPPFEGPFTSILNKLGIGIVHYLSFGIDADYLVTDKKLLYYSRADTSCGNYGPLTLGVDKLIANDPVQIYPNPASDELTIKTNNILPYVITIVNMLGQSVFTTKTVGQQTTVSVSNIPAGVYNISINSGNEQSNHKLVVEH